MKEKTLRRASRAVVPFLLPVRTQCSWWQTVKAWFQQGWQRLWQPPVIIQPPLQPTRHKPFPQRPHQQRRQAVFAALNVAPAGLTRRQLIAHVRSVTGIGCSEKLITQWRQEQCRDAETGRHGDGAKKRCGVLGLLCCLCLNSCATTTPLPPPALPTEITISPAPSEAPSISNIPFSPSSPTHPRLLRIKLTLNAPHELQVKVGQQIAVGTLLSDRKTARQRLLVQHAAVQAAQQHLQTQQQLAEQSLRQLQSLGLDLPPTTFATEQTAIKRAETEAIATRRAVEVQKQKLAVLSEAMVIADRWPVAGNTTIPSIDVSHPQETAPTTNAPATDHRPLTTDHLSLIQQHEAAKLAQAQDKQLLASSEIEWHKAKLTTARDVRIWEEQKHRVEITRQLLAARSQQQQAAIEAARLTAQLAEIELQLAQLAAVRAPFAGTIKRIEWEDMNDEKISVVVYLATGSR